MYLFSVPSGLKQVLLFRSRAVIPLSISPQPSPAYARDSSAREFISQCLTSSVFSVSLFFLLQVRPALSFSELFFCCQSEFGACQRYKAQAFYAEKPASCPTFPPLSQTFPLSPPPYLASANFPNEGIVGHCFKSRIGPFFLFAVRFKAFLQRDLKRHGELHRQEDGERNLLPPPFSRRSPLMDP